MNVSWERSRSYLLSASPGPGTLSKLVGASFLLAAHVAASPFGLGRQAWLLPQKPSSAV
jgi:hypothetical protein